MTDENAVTSAETESAPTGAEIVRAANHVVVYANSAQIIATLFDFTIDFGTLQGVGEAGRARVESFLAVRMSPQHAKVLAGILADQVARYEKEFGEISTSARTPPPPEEGHL
jgi:hypothetical protein